MAFSALPDELAGGETLGVGREARQIAVPAFGKLALLHQVETRRQLGKFFAIGPHAVQPVPPQLAAAAPDAFLKMLAHAVRHEKARVFRPVIGALGQTDFLDAERLAMSGAGVVLVRRTVADMALDDDQRRRQRSLEGFERLAQPPGVVGVADVLDIPAIGAKPRRHIVAEGEFGMALDRHLIGIVDPAEVAEHEMPRERSRFVADAFHHVAVAAEGVNGVIEDLVARPVESLRQPALANRHAHRHAAALAERAGRGFHAGGDVMFRMAGTSAVKLAKRLDVIERHGGSVERLLRGVDGLHARQMQRRIKQHRRVSVGQDETVPVGPCRIFRIGAQGFPPERVDHRRQRHRRSGMARFRFLHGVHRQRADRVDADIVDRTSGHRRLHAAHGR